MARNTIVSISDDLGGKGEAAPFTFSVNGIAYEIDLNEANTAKYLKAFQPLIDAGREVKAKARVSSGRAVNSQAAIIRAWAVEQGMPVGSRGRIAPEIVSAYAEANSTE